MATRTSNVVAKLGARTQQYDRAILRAIKLNRDLIVSMGKASSTAKKSGKAFGGLSLAINQTLEVAKKIIRALKTITKHVIELSDASSRLEEIQQKFNIVFRDSRKETNEWAESFAKDINRNSTDVKKYAAQLQNTFVPLGFMREESTELSKALVKLGFDLSSFNDIPTDRVLTDIQSALLGNVRAVRKYGISANETAIFQEALVNGWVTEKSEIDGVIKARAINNIILRATADAQGDLTRTLDQTANVRREYNSTITRSKEILGDYVNDFLTPLRRALSTQITKWNEALAAKREYDRALAGNFDEDTNLERVIDTQLELIDVTERRAVQIRESIRANVQVAGSEVDLNVARKENLHTQLLKIDTLKKELEALREAKKAQDQLDQDVADKAKADEADAKARQKIADEETKFQQELVTLKTALLAVDEKSALAQEKGREFNKKKKKANINRRRVHKRK